MLGIDLRYSQVPIRRISQLPIFTAFWSRWVSGVHEAVAPGPTGGRQFYAPVDRHLRAKLGGRVTFSTERVERK